MSDDWRRQPRQVNPQIRQTFAHNRDACRGDHYPPQILHFSEPNPRKLKYGYGRGSDHNKPRLKKIL